MKNPDLVPVPSNESERLKALYSHRLLDTNNEAQFDRLTELASIICGVPIALISLIDKDRQWFKSRVGLDAAETPRDISFCQFAIMGNDVFQVEDAIKDARFKNNPLVTGAPDIRFYAGYPLQDSNGFALGTLCVIDRVPKKLDEKQLRSLQLLSEEVVSQIVARNENSELKDFIRLIDVSIDMICVAGSDGFFKRINPAFSRTLGWSEKEILEKSFFEYIHPDDIEKTIKEIENLSSGKKTIGFVCRFRTHSGKYIMLSWSVSPDVETGNLYAIARDITEDKKNEELLHNSLKEIQDIKHALDESAIVAVTDSKGIIKFVNDKFCNISGYTKQELIGQDHRIINSGYHSKDFFAGLWKTISNGKIFRAEIKNKSKDGKFYWVDTTIVPFMDNNDKPQQYIAIRHDITARKNSELLLSESEKKHRTFFENTSALMCTHDLNGVILSVNNSSANALGFTKENMVGSNFLSIIKEENKNHFTSYLEKIKQDGTDTGILEVTDSKGRNMVWEYHNVMVADEIGKPYVLGSSLDITSRFILEKELKESKKIAENSLKTKDIFLANMSHEIRTPMNAIIGFSELLGSTNLNEEQTDFVESIKVSGENLMVIINDILDFSKIESGKLTLEKVPVNLRLLLNNVKKQMIGKAIEKKLKLSFLIENEIPEFIFADPVRLNQILINLIGNALKFTSEGKIEVFCSLLNFENKSVVIEFIVKDSGIGIAKDKQGKIFERFLQADDNTTRKYGGTGLGLSITSMLVDIFGGSIRVESELCKGSSFIVSLPFQTSDSGPLENNKIGGEKVKNPHARILLVEDNEMNQKFALKVLENAGIIADLAPNGRVAIEILETENYDLILMDLQMPEMDGYVATKYIRTILKKNVPIMAMTAHSLVGEKDKCFSIGMNEYLSKPFKPYELIEKINLILHGNHNGPEKEIILSPKNKAEVLFNLKDLHSLSNGDAAFVKQSLDIFQRSTSEDLLKMSEAIKIKDITKVNGIAHKMKSTFSIICADSSVHICQILENISEPNFEIIQQNFEKLEANRNEIVKQIN